MPDSGENVRFQVLINGEPRGTAGIERVGVLTVHLTWVRRDLDKAPKGLRMSRRRKEEWIGNEVEVALAGLDSAKGQTVSWFFEKLKVGDEVVLRILPPGVVDVPAPRSRRVSAKPKKSAGRGAGKAKVSGPKRRRPSASGLTGDHDDANRT